MVAASADAVALADAVASAAGSATSKELRLLKPNIPNIVMGTATVVVVVASDMAVASDVVVVLAVGSERKRLLRPHKLNMLNIATATVMAVVVAVASGEVVSAAAASADGSARKRLLKLHKLNTPMAATVATAVGAVLVEALAVAALAGNARKMLIKGPKSSMLPTITTVAADLAAVGDSGVDVEDSEVAGNAQPRQQKPWAGLKVLLPSKIRSARWFQQELFDFISSASQDLWNHTHLKYPSVWTVFFVVELCYLCQSILHCPELKNTDHLCMLW